LEDIGPQNAPYDCFHAFDCYIYLKNDPYLCLAMAVTDLYILVQRLDKAERDRVIANAKRGKKEGPIVYLDLFEDLCKAASYTSDKVFLAANKQASYAKSFAQMKAYLFDFILDALRSHRTRAGEEKPKDFQIREWIEEAHILRGKLLFDQSYHRLEKARTEAEACQFYELLLETLKLMRTYMNEQPEKDSAVALQAILQRIGEVGYLIHLNCQLLTVRDELFGFLRRSAVHDANMRDGLLAKIERITALDALKSTSVEAKTNHHLCLALFTWLEGELQQAWQHHHEVYLLWRDAGEFAKARKVQQSKLLNNFLTTSIAAGESTDFIDALEMLEKAAYTNPEAQAEATQNTAYIRLQYFLSKAEWDNALKIEEEFLKKPIWATLKSNTSRLQMFYLSFARLYFIIGDAKNARKYLRRLDAERTPGIHDDKWGEAIVLGVLLSYSEVPDAQPKATKPKEKDIVNQVRSARRAMKLLYNPAVYLDELLQGIKRIANLPEDKRIAAWRGLSLTLRTQVGREQYDSASQLFLAWIQSQVEGKPLSQVLREAFPRFEA
jgi:hypothetical protein